MTQMHIANVTAQNHTFVYRVAEGSKAVEQTIPAGGQIRISANRGDLSMSDVHAIVDQHEKYGLISFDAIGKTRDYVQLVYSLDKPVNITKMFEQIHANRDILVERGKINRQAAAVAVSKAVEEHIENTGLPEQLKAVEISVEEIKGSRVIGDGARSEDLRRDLSEVKPLAEGIRVTRDAPSSPVPRRASRQGGRR